MEAFGKFSLSDFLVYLLPGLASGAALAAIASAFPVGAILHQLDFGLGGGALLLVLGYVLGALLADLSSKITNLVGKRLGLRDPRLSIPPQIDSTELMTVLARRLGQQGSHRDWAPADFYACRTLVREHLPRSSAEAERENTLRQMGQNLAVAVVLWAIAGIVWVFHFQPPLGALVSVGFIASILAAGSQLLVSLVRRMHDSGQREVRELCSAVLVGEATGLFGSRISKCGQVSE